MSERGKATALLVWRALAVYQEKQGVPPTIRELAGLIERAPSVVKARVDNLVELGVVERAANKRLRLVRLPGVGGTLVAALANSKEAAR